MSAGFSPSFGDQHTSFLNKGGSLAFSMSPSSGHTDNRTHSHSHSHHHHHHHNIHGSDSLPRSVPFLLYPSSMDPASLGLYEGSFRGHGPSLLPYLSPFHHSRFGVYECPFEPAFIQKRNERERQRVKCVNQGYAKLRDHLPGAVREKRLSKVETLRAAIRYIKYLQSLVEGKSQGSQTSGAAASRLVDSRHSDGGSPQSHVDSSSPGLDCGESEGSGC